MTNSREIRRQEAINKTKNTIKKFVIWGEDITPYRENIILEIMTEFMTSRRTSIEYLDTAELIIKKEIANTPKSDLTEDLVEDILKDGITNKETVQG